MSADWPEVRLEDVTSKLGDGLHGTPEYDENGEYYFINGNNLGDGKIVIDEKTKRASKEEYLKHKKDLNDRTILVSINGTIGNVGLYNGEKVFLGKSACYFNVKEEVDKQFVRYVVTSKYFQDYISSLATGSTIKNVSLKLMRDFTFRLPPLNIQKEISKILEGLDNKIELNRQINQTIEQIAQAIFKSWFVDFEPVKAKIEAKQNGQDPERAAMRNISGKTDEELDQLNPEQRQQLTTTAALFPDELEETELGEIPKGWRFKSLDEVATYLNGLALQKFPPRENEDGLPVIKIAEMRSGFSDKSGRATEDLDQNYIIQDGDILFSWSGSLLVKQWHLGRGALNQHLFKVTSDIYPKWFYYFSTLHHLAWFQSIAASKATTMGHIQRKHLSDAKVAIGTSELLNAGDKIIGPLLDKSLVVMLESKTLEESRDSLLPKLLSGELEVLVA